MKERLIPFFILLLISFELAAQKGRLDTARVRLGSIEIVKKQDEKPPVINFDLTLFNIFVSDNGELFYYYDSTFIPRKKFDEYRIENLDTSFLYTTTRGKLKKVLKELKDQQRLKESRVVLAEKNHDIRVTKKLFKDIFTPLQIEHVQVGHVTDELLTILNTVR